MLAPERAPAFFAFIKEREMIRQRKLAGLPHPVTEDEILRDYKFTNVRRHHDRTSTNLIKEFYEPHFDDDRRSVLMNAALFRYFGTSEFAEAIGWQDYDDFDFEEIKRLAAQRLANRDRVFTGAYVITNQGISAPKEEVVVDYFLRGLHVEVPNLLELVQKTRSWQKVVQRMAVINGFGGTGFMAKEILLDTTYTAFWGLDVHSVGGYRFTFPADWQTWTPIGPGARRGAARVNGVDDVEGSSAKPFLGNSPRALETIMSLHALQAVGDNWPINEYGALSPTDIQFQLCEFDKYERVRLGQGRPRSLYHPRG